MAQPTTIADLKELHKKDSKLRDVKKDLIVEILMKDTASDNQQVVDEIRALRTTLEESNTLLKNRMDKLESTVELQKRIITAQQKAWEDIDAMHRSNKLVILGLNEDANEGDVIDEMFNILQVESGPYAKQRIGKEAAQGRKRPILVTLENPLKRRDILAKSGELKKAGQRKVGDTEVDWSKVYIKKDQHPAVRREWKRLNEVCKAEQRKPENAGHTVRIDYKKRQVTRDGVAIESWRSDFLM